MSTQTESAPTSVNHRPEAQSEARRWGRIALGAILVLLSTVPLYRLAAGAETGPAGTAVVEIIEVQADFLWSGALVIALLALLAGFVLDADRLERLPRTTARLLLGLSPALYAAALAAVAFGTTLWFTVVILEGKPNLIDVFPQLLQARFMVAGQLAAPVSELVQFWVIQNTVVTDTAWVSMYPPGHSAALAGFFALGIAQASGAAFMAVTAAFTYLVARRLLPGQEGIARLGSAIVAISPFLVAHSGAYMNHGSAAAVSVLAIYFGLRARDGAAAWSLVTGLALGWLFATRPLFAVVVGFGVVVPIGIQAWRQERLGTPALLVRAALTVAGGLPLALAVAAYNAHFFGEPTLFGYEAAWGPDVGLGFHRDPWGNLYSPLTALALTSGDLTALSLALLETPLPLVALIGVWIATTPARRKGEGILLAWALLPVVANFFYWHHGFFMGPRMLAEAAPAWGLLTAVALAGLARRIYNRPPPATGRFQPRAAVSAVLLLAAAGIAVFAPLRLVRTGGEFLPSMRIDPPNVPERSIVFVHGAWESRVFAGLAEEGRGLEEVQAVMLQNDLCQIQRYLNEPTPARRSELVTTPRSGIPPHLFQLEPFPGNSVLLSRSSLAGDGRLRLPPECTREILADRFGIVDMSPLMWRGDVPGLESGRSMYVRDMGPERNRLLLARHPDRPAFLLRRHDPTRSFRILPYDEGMTEIWSASRGGSDGVGP